MQEECTERKTQLAWMERAFLDEQAGILAKVLKAGEPCPVCGSIHHPCPAQMTEGAPEKEELEKYRKETADVEKKTNDASLSANAKLVQLKALEEEIQKSVKSFDSSIQEEEIEKSLTFIGQQMNALGEAEKDLRKKLEVVKKQWQISRSWKQRFRNWSRCRKSFRRRSRSERISSLCLRGIKQI